MSLGYSDQTKNAFVYAFNKWSQHGHKKMTTGHLLYGLAIDNSSFRPILQEFGITAESVHTALIDILGSSPSAVSLEQYGLDCDDPEIAFKRAIEDAEWLLDPRSFSAFRQSQDIALKYCDNGVERIHLLIALLKEGGEVLEILDYLEVNPPRLEISLRRLYVRQRLPYPVYKTLEDQGYSLEQLEEHIPKWVQSRGTPKEQKDTPGYEVITFVNSDHVKVWDEFVECMALNTDWEPVSTTLSVVFRPHQ
jgi:ATP-dependent Clp protease ATP-binding subunit ClpA